MIHDACCRLRARVSVAQEKTVRTYWSFWRGLKEQVRNQSRILNQTLKLFCNYDTPSSCDLGQILLVLDWLRDERCARSFARIRR
jgi:hypothetical protein